MKFNKEDIYDFAMVKGMIAPAIVILNNAPKDDDSKQMFFQSLANSTLILKSLAVKNKTSFKQAVDNCLECFNNTETLIEAFNDCFEVKTDKDETIKEKSIEVFKIVVEEECLEQIRELLLITNKRINDVYNN